MSDHAKQPRKDDAVLGQGINSASRVVLGGLEGIKRRLNSPIVSHRLAALPDALHYGQRGLFLVIRALRDDSHEVQYSAYALLQNRPEPRVQHIVKKYYTQIRYAYLEQALSEQQWQVADQETRIAMFRAIGFDPDLELQPNPYRIAECPCRDLQIIDQLWIKYSQGRFGFSVQHSIWQQYDDIYWDKAEVWARFGDRVSWRTGLIFTDKHWKRHSEITFNLNAPIGHLPFLGDGFGIFTVEAIARRLVECQSMG